LLQGFAGCEVEEILSRENRAWVEHVGEKAAYIKTSDNDFIIFSRKLLTPYSVAFEQHWQHVKKCITPGVEILYQRSNLYLGNCVNVLLSPADGCGKITTATKIKRDALRLAYNASLILFTDFRFDGVLKDAVNLVRNSPLSNLLQSLEKVIGLGPGLTPAGDDFISGVLLGLRFCGVHVSAENLVQKAIQRSCWPSWKMIEHAVHGCGFTPIYRLSISLMNGNNVVENLVDSLRVGASTGMATVCGFLETVKRFHISLSRIRFKSSSISAGGDHSMSITSTP